MLKYLKNAFSDRAFFARSAFSLECDLYPDSKRIRFADVEKAFTKAIPDELEGLYDEYLNLRTDLNIAESDATYRAGWLDGIVVGVLAATQSKNHAQ